MKLSDFLSELCQIESPRALFIQNRMEANDTAQHVFVGWGRWGQETGDRPTNKPFLITNKGTAQRFGLAHDYTSVTRFVLNPPEGYLEGWHLWAKRPLRVTDALSSVILVADDASPDTVMALLMILARLAGVTLSEIPSAWIEAVDHWEQAGIADDPWHSWCALESALAHRHFPREGPISATSFGLAWRDALRFAAQCLVLQLDPLNIPALPHTREYVQARAAMEQEQDIYRDWLQRTASLQFSLPLIGATNRRTLVDGLIVEAQQITGATKVFLRNDRTNSPLGRGFSFLALLMPASPGQEMDITLSVDPSRGVNLLKLWEAIERTETTAWEEIGEVRPADFPRQLEGVENIYEQPWYIDPTQTLIARPRSLQDGLPGSRLTWNHVREVLWQELNPLRGVYVRKPGTDVGLPLLQLTPEPANEYHAKLFFAAKWINTTGEETLLLPQTLSESTFFLRVLAGMLHRGRSSDPVDFRDVPAPGSWNLVKLEGGLAVVSRDGLFVLDDWSDEALQTAEMRQDFDRAATLDADLLHFESEELAALAKDVGGLLNRERRAHSLDNLLLRAAHLGIRFAEILGRYAILPVDPNARLIRHALEDRWSLNRRLDACHSELRAAEASLRSLNELHTLRIGRFIAIYGFALLLAMAASPYVGKAIYHAWYGGPETNDAPGLFNLSCFGGISLLLILFLKLWLALETPLKRAAENARKGR